MVFVGLTVYATYAASVYTHHAGHGASEERREKAIGAIAWRTAAVCVALFLIQRWAFPLQRFIPQNDGPAVIMEKEGFKRSSVPLLWKEYEPGKFAWCNESGNGEWKPYLLTKVEEYDPPEHPR